MFKRIFLVALAVLFLTAGCGNKTKEELFKEGSKLMKENNPRGAIIHFKNALEKDQNYIDARFQLAKAYIATNKYEQAEKEFQKVLRQDPSRVYIRLDLSRTYFRMNKPAEAINEARLYLQSKPEDPEGLEAIGLGYAIKGEYKEAEAYLLKALTKNSNLLSAKVELAGVYMAKGDNKSARTLLDEIINKDNKNTKAYYMLASLEKTAGNKDEAIKIYKKIAEIKPSEANALFMAGMLHIENGELKKADGLAEDMLKKFPKRPEGHRLKGMVYYHEKKFGDAVTSLQNSLKVQPNIGALYFLGLSHYNRGELEQAISQFQKTLDFNPSFVQARLMIATILLQQKRVDDSIQEIKRVLQLDDKNALAHNILGSAYMAKGMYDEAMKELDKAVEIDPKMIDAHLKKGLFSLTKGKTKETEAELKTAVQISPKLLNTRLLLVSYYMRLKDYDKAIKTLKEGVTGEKSDALLYNSIAGALLAKGKTNEAEAIKYLEKAKGNNPEYFAPYFNLASWYIARKNHEKAIGEYKAVLSKDSKNVNALLGIASIYELKGNNEALTYYKKAKDTNKPEGFLSLAGYYVRKKDNDKAIGVLDEAIKVEPRNGPALEMKGNIYLSQKKYQDAVKTFEKIEEINPERGFGLVLNTYMTMQDYNKALNKLEGKLKKEPQRLDLMAETAKVYALKGDTQKAIDNANKIITQKPNSAYGYVVLASIYENKKDLSRAIETVKRALQYEGKNAEVRILLAELYAKKKDYANAINTYEDILKKSQGNIPVMFTLGTVYDISGKKKEAVKTYLQVIKKSENYVPALNNLSYLYSEGYGSKEEALKFANKAYALAPNNAGIIDTLGYALLKNSKSDEAAKTLEKAVSLLPENPSVRYHLALAYKQSGKNSKAKEQLEKALAKNDFPEASNARRLLEEIKGK